nr:unnamed protein product [Callosobruchus chinensis]
MPFEDNKDFWQEFILLYQEHSCLWDVKSQDYRNKQKRNGAYETLLQRCKELFPKANKEFVIKKISSLRASFRRQLRRLNAAKKSGTGAEDVPGTTLWYFELLSFLMDQEESCPAVPSIMLDESDVDEHSQVSVSIFITSCLLPTFSSSRFLLPVCVFTV